MDPLRITVIVLIVALLILLIPRKKKESLSAIRRADVSLHKKTGDVLLRYKKFCMKPKEGRRLTLNLNAPSALGDYFMSSFPTGSLYSSYPSSGPSGPDIECTFEKGFIPKVYWNWDGQTLTLLEPLVAKSNGTVYDIQRSYIQKGLEGEPVRLGLDDQKVVLATNGIVTDGYLSLSLGRAGLMWSKSDPLRFEVLSPQDVVARPVSAVEEYPGMCRQPGESCLYGSDCCPPNGACIEGQCAACIGDPEDVKRSMCPGDDHFVACMGGVYRCQKKCDGKCPGGCKLNNLTRTYECAFSQKV